MRKLVLFATFALLLSIILSPASSTATYIDFRLDPFGSSANGSLSYSRPIESLTLTFTPFGSLPTNKLFWDSTDGFGVQAGGYEGDEIEHPESLRIEFSSEIFVSYFDLTDLFYETRYSKSYEEMGSWSLDGTHWNPFSQTDHFQLPDPASNGEFTLDINKAIKAIWFTAPGKTISGQDHEFSVAGVRVAVPEPATMLLLGFGLIGLASFGRKRFLRS